VCDLVCRASQHRSHIVDHVLHNHDALGHAKAPEGGVGGQVGPAGGGAASQVGDVVGIVHVKQNLLNHLQEEEEKSVIVFHVFCGLKIRETFTNQNRFIRSVASIGVVLDICSHDPPIVHETHLKEATIDKNHDFTILD